MEIEDKFEIWSINYKKICEEEQAIQTYKTNFLNQRPQIRQRFTDKWIDDLIYQNDYIKRLTKSIEDRKKQNRDIVFEICYDLENANFPREEWENHQHLIVSLRDCLWQHNIDIGSTFPTLLLILKETERKYNNEKKKSRTSLKSIKSLKNDIKIKKSVEDLRNRAKQLNKPSSWKKSISKTLFFLGGILTSKTANSFFGQSNLSTNSSLQLFGNNSVVDVQFNPINHSVTYPWEENSICPAPNWKEILDKQVNFNAAGDIESYLESNANSLNATSVVMKGEIDEEEEKFFDAVETLGDNESNRERERERERERANLSSLGAEKYNDLLIKLESVQDEYNNYRQEYKFKALDLKNALETNNQEWIAKGLLEPKEVEANLIALEKNRDYWKEKYEKADLKPDDLPVDWENKLKEHREFSKRPNITIAEYNNLLNNQKPVDLPLDWKEQLKNKKSLLTRITELEKRPTQENYNKLKNNQKPVDLPLNWKSELASIPNLKEKIKKQEEQISNLKSRPNISRGEFAQYKSPEQIAEVEKLARKQEADKYKDFINPIDQEQIITIATQAGYQFRQIDIDKAVNRKEQEWKNKGLIDPRNQLEVEYAGLVKKAKYEQIKQELDKVNTNNKEKLTQARNDLRAVRNELASWQENFRNQSAAWVYEALTRARAEKKETKLALKKENLAHQQTKNEKEDYQQSQDKALVELSQECHAHYQTQQKLASSHEKETKLTQTNSELQTKLNTTQKEVDDLIFQLNKLNDNLLKQREGYQFEIARLNSEKQMLKQAYQSDVAERERKISGLESSLQSRGSEVIELKSPDVAAPKNQLSRLRVLYEKVQQQAKSQANFLWNISKLLASAGIGFKAGRKLERYELEENIRERVDALIKEKKQARQAQQEAEQERDYWQSRAGNSQINNSSFRAHSDLSRKQGDDYKNQVEIVRKDNEKAIIQRLNVSLELNLKEPNLETIIGRIQELISKDPTTFSGKSIRKELKQVQKAITKPENTPFGEDLKVIKKLELASLEELFPGRVDKTFTSQVELAANYQQLVQTRQAFLQKYLGKEEKAQTVSQPSISKSTKIIREPTKERIIWISLLIVSLLTFCGLIMKSTKVRIKKQSS